VALTRKRSPVDVGATIGAFPFFKGVRKSEIDELAAMALCHEYPRNNILSYRGDPAGNVFLVISGRVKVILTEPRGTLRYHGRIRRR
jgi:CRP-like cAMP-binding protein